MNRKIRVLIAKPGLDGHYRGAIVLANALSNAGMEVIYTGLRKSPENIVKTAIDEDVDVIGLSILSGAHIPLTRKISKMLKETTMDEILLLVGGIIPEDDIPVLKEEGVNEVFPSGSSTEDIIKYIEDWFVSYAKN